MVTYNTAAQDLTMVTWTPASQRFSGINQMKLSRKSLLHCPDQKTPTKWPCRGEGLDRSCRLCWNDRQYKLLLHIHPQLEVLLSKHPDTGAVIQMQCSASIGCAAAWSALLVMTKHELLMIIQRWSHLSNPAHRCTHGLLYAIADVLLETKL